MFRSLIAVTIVTEMRDEIKPGKLGTLSYLHSLIMNFLVLKFQSVK